MKASFDIEQLIESATITSEVDYERAMVADRKLRLLAKDSTHFKSMRRKLRDLIAAYEGENWANHKQVSSGQLKLADIAEKRAEEERVFVVKRKNIIRKKLKAFDLTSDPLRFLTLLQLAVY
ncbi:MAG TPA: hypothetical protein VGM31_08790 [Puia sp.]